MALPSLLGPPELRAPTPPPQAQPVVPFGNPFVDLMVANYNDAAKVPVIAPPMGYTENGASTFLNSGNPCVDFFFPVVPTTPTSYFNAQLPLAWAHDDLTTLKLICNLRGVRGTEKSDKEGFYTAAFWLHKHHPKTLACNVASFAEFGYFKDLPKILYRLLEGEDVRKKQKAEWNIRKSGAGRTRRGRRMRGHGRLLRYEPPPSTYGNSPFYSASPSSSPYGGYSAPHQHPWGLKPPFSGDRGRRSSNRKYGRGDGQSKEARIQMAKERAQSEKEKASVLRNEKKAAMAKKAIVRYERDPDFRFLYEKVSDLFAECLKSDIENFKANQYKKISLAVKWCPSIDSFFDKATLLCESIAKKVFPRESYLEYEGVDEAHYVYRVRDRLRKEVLVPLRKVLELPEVYIGANQWGLIPYNRVASVAMKFYKEKFLKHDEERFKKYLADVKAGKSTIAAGALLPHEIIESLNHGDGGQVAELQWKRMMDDLLKQGKMKNCLAVCDVSGSMNGTPMEVSVALGLLVSELIDEPWKGKVITFSHNPQLHQIQGHDLSTKCNFIRTMEWGRNTNFQKVFDLILQVEVNGKLKPEQMIKRIFVFSDMEFDQASTSGPWETDYQAIQRKYTEKGYGNAVPQIIFWNLRHSKSTPMPSNQPGVALLSGFSKNLMKLFLDNEGEVRPDLVMEAAISGEEYQKLAVLD
ncbi:hypothetical protein D8674_029951 [Pyrus ussuriensis x Pyrus communis]|uniref:Uncharacterized protein n=1 Tax=Pyrus ussuriensis x Pyrus communis TaxID=2448454 RepID=A0A5N5IEB2_9ROSA|nr:hypothetical protein D8674_029951 [Pyrus ussuriensis x Pyrus communis]